MIIERMERTADRISGLMKVLSNQTRLLILCQLVDGEKSVGELADLLSVREQAVSQQLGLLRKDGLVRGRRDGQTVFYSVARDDVAPLMNFLHDTYCMAPQSHSFEAPFPTEERS